MKSSGVQLDLPFEGKPLKEDPKYNDPLRANREKMINEVLIDARKKAKQSYEELLSLGVTPSEASVLLSTVTRVDTPHEDD